VPRKWTDLSELPVRTVCILRYLESGYYRRRILGQLNKGEALHDLREFLLFANKGTPRKK
jgi:TnpA family transposase